MINTYSLGQAYNFTKYGIEEGLAHEQTTDVCQDKFGNLWIATQGGGVSRFNGVEFKNFTVRDGLLSNYVREITTDQNGNVWMATAAGISKYNGHRIIDVTSGEGVGQKSVNSVLIDLNNRLWFATTDKGISFIDADGVINSFDQSNGFVNDKVIDIKQDHEGTIWLVTIVSGVYKYRDGRFSKIVSTADIKGYILSITISDDQILLATNRGVFTYGDSTKVIDALDGVFVKSIVSRGDELWVISPRGLMKSTSKQTMNFGEKEGFSSFLPSFGFTDREGNIWIGTEGDGIYKYTNSAFIKFDERHGLLNNDVLSILKDRKGDYWFGTDGGGVYVYDGSEMINYNVGNGLSNNYITSLAEDDEGRVWLGTRGDGIISFYEGKFHLFNENSGLINNSVRKLFKSSENELWIATVNGLSKWNGEIFENFNIDNGLLDNIIWSICEDGGSIYFATRNGVNVYENGSLDTYFASDQIFNKRINTIVRSDSQELLIGYSGHGFKIVNIEDNTETAVTSEDGLVSDIIHDIRQIEDSTFLITTERGIDLLAISGNQSISIAHMGNNKSGLGLAKTNAGSIYADGDLTWVGTQQGVYRFESGMQIENDVAPIVYISSVNLIDEEDNPIKSYLSFNSLKHTQNSIYISYFGNYLNGSDNVTYQYRMTSLQDDWSTPSISNSSMFTNLPSGEYVFEVRAISGEGKVSSMTDIFRFKIIPPIWERSWFYFLMTLFMVAFIRYIYLYRVKLNVKKVLEVEKIREEEATKIRKNMARDFHDNMGNQLASITVFSNLIGLKLKDRTEEIDNLLSNIEKHSKSLYNGTKDFIWSMNPESDNLNEIFTYLKDFGEDFFDRTDIKFYADNEMSSEKVEVPSGWSRQIVLIFKEAMTNVLKHSKASRLSISLQLDSNSFVIKCIDDGIGLNGNSKGNGFRNMKSRATQIGCEFAINNQHDSISGVEVTLKGNLPSKESSTGIKIF